MKILIVGGGGREHALAWKASNAERVEQVYVAPGNAGTQRDEGMQNVPINPTDQDALLAFAEQNAIDLTIIGPEQPLVEGIVDRFKAAGLPCFGPTQGAAQLEGSKAFAKAFLHRHDIPTAACETFDDFAAARRYIKAHGAPVVIKADGLAAGKGVVIAHSVSDAVDAAESMLVNDTFSAAGQRIIVEDFLEGEEASFICIVDGEHFIPLATSQDHKARDDGDLGPNTGGMGAYSPAPVVTDAVYERIVTQVIEPTVQGLVADGLPYQGFLYAGIMIDAQGEPQVLEFNCRLGDPETQPIMMRLQSDLIELCELAVAGELEKMRLEWDPRTALGVVMAAGGYPGDYRSGLPIEGLDTVDALEPTGVKVFHAGSQDHDGQVTTSGGRVLCVTALDDTVHGAQQRAYQAVEQIKWSDCYYRKDIGYRAVASQSDAASVDADSDPAADS